MSRDLWTRRPWCVAHRGAVTKAPENTLKSFALAMQLGADMIELDVRLSKNRRVVVIHDAELDRTSDGTGLVRSYTLEELKRFDFGDGERIPTLEEVLELVRDKMLINIEIKEPDMAREVVDIVERYNAKEKVVISSFIHPVLAEIKKLNPEIKIGLLFVHRPIDPAKFAKEVNADFLHPYYELVDKSFVEQSHKQNVGVLVWTVDGESDIKKMFEVGVDGVITNDVETCLKVRKNIFGF